MEKSELRESKHEIEEQSTPTQGTQEMKDHLIVLSAIQALRKLTTKLMKENQKKKKNQNAIANEIQLAKVFINQLKEAPSSQRLHLDNKIFDALTRIENIFNQFNIPKDQPKTDAGIQRNYFKASFLQKLEILNIQAN